MAEPDNGSSRWKWVVLSLLLVVAALALGTWLNVSSLARKLTSRSVPGLDFQSLHVGWNSLDLKGGRYQLPGSTTVSVSSRSLHAAPSFFSFLTDRVTVADVEVEEPGIRFERAASAPVSPRVATESAASQSPGHETPRSLHVGELTVKAGSGAFVDHTVGSPPAQILFRNLNASLKELEWPEKEGASEVALSCIVQGAPEGSLKLNGWFDPATRSADLTLGLAGCDLNLLHPYLRGRMHTVPETAGTADLDLAFLMTEAVYEAKGELRLREMSPPASSEKFLGVPSLLLREYLKLGHNRLSIPFTVRGDLNRERFPPDMGSILASVLSGRLKLKPSVTPEQMEKIEKGLKKLKDLLR